MRLIMLNQFLHIFPFKIFYDYFTFGGTFGDASFLSEYVIDIGQSFEMHNCTLMEHFYVSWYYGSVVMVDIESGC